MTHENLDLFEDKITSGLVDSIAGDSLKDSSIKLVEGAIKPTLQLLLQSCKEFQLCFHHHAEDESTLIILGMDMPFLVDSIVNALKKYGCNINLVAHRSFNIERDENGVLIGIDNDAPSSKKEIVLQFYISKYYDQLFYEDLQLKLQQILECISLAVVDWQSMRADVREVAEHIMSTRAVENTDEVVSLLKWMNEGNFIFLGVFENTSVGGADACCKGIFKSDLYANSVASRDLYEHNRDPQNSFASFKIGNGIISIRKWDSLSVVHRVSHMDWVEIKRFDKDGVCIGSINFIGLFTSSLYYQSIKTIPLLNKKIAKVVERYGYAEDSHNCKELITSMEDLPRDELLQMTEDEIYTMATGMVSLALAPKVRIFVRKDQMEKFVSCVLFIPQNRFNSTVNDRIEALLCKKFNGVISKQRMQINESQLVCIYLLLRTNNGGAPDYDVKATEKEIENIISLWEDDLLICLSRKHDRAIARRLHNKFKNAFNVEYTYDFSAKRAVHDVKFIEEALSTNAVKFCCYSSPRTKDNHSLQLKIFSPNQELPLSSTLPKLENLGLYADDMMLHSARVKEDSTESTVYIYCFNLRPDAQTSAISLQTIEFIEQTLDKIWCNVIEDDAFNSLVLKCGLNWRYALLFRSYSSYLQQIDHTLSPTQILSSLVAYGEITTNLVQLFELKFNPDINFNQSEIDLLKKEIECGVQSAAFAWQEKVLSILYRVINATKRVNFYKRTEQEKYEDYLSFKICSKEVEEIPMPKPYAEIFVYAKRFCGIHLRGGKVARGGLRWSDRKEDFRTEVLGLMKAQMAKNAVIVPVGSKGGFVLKEVTMESGSERFMQEGIACYQQFLSGLLDITDNVLDGKIIAPKGVVRHDGDDPYLVVAADKGTATFSDIANEVAHKYNFWLGDAFASGGSAGYDHKKMAITARGAWICVKQLFLEMDVDIEHTVFSAVGIGDMAGDVFGNGMLLSNNMKLVAAFNHKHIFLDPNPDPEVSFIQRKRLFDMPRSQWSDYDPAVISSGGGVFNRTDKYIKLSEEVRAALGITEDILAPEALIAAILKAPVDLIWNGGIGTYVKSSSEAHWQVGDKSNDELRINGCELRCKVFGEGGNLGMTQLGRIEYAGAGGRVSADFIDNSAGVDCSDHEVNIKIVLNRLMKAGKMTLRERNELLVGMTHEVEKLVLQDNVQQTQLLSLEEYMGVSRLQDHAWLIKYLSEKGILNSQVEFLPTVEALSLMIADGKKLKRPEIAVLMAYAKNSMAAMLEGIEFSERTDFSEILLNYFPVTMHKKYQQDLLKHELHNEIVVTVITNFFINTLGCTSFHQMVAINNETPLRIVQAFLVVIKLFSIELLLDNVGSIAQGLKMNKSEFLVAVQVHVEQCIEWILRHHNDLNDTHAIIALYQPHITPIVVQLNCNADGLEPFTLLQYGIQILDIVHIKQKSGQNLNKVMKAYLEIGEKMHLSWMRLRTVTQNEPEHVNIVALKIIAIDLEETHIKLTLQYLNVAMNDDIFSQDKLVTYNKFIATLKLYEGDHWISILIIALGHIKNLCSVIDGRLSDLNVIILDTAKAKQ